MTMVMHSTVLLVLMGKLKRNHVIVVQVNVGTLILGMPLSLYSLQNISVVFF